MSAQVIRFPSKGKPRNELEHDWRSDVPRFDPANPTHRRAWENMVDFGRKSLADKWEA